MTASDNDPAFNSGLKSLRVECIGKGNSSFFRLNYLSANIVLSTTPGLGVYQWKRSKNVDYYVHIPHSAGNITMYRMFGIDYYDAILLSAQRQVDDVRLLEQTRNLPAKEIVKVGIPYMDEMIKRLENSPKLDNHTRTVLVAPSWGKSAIFSVYGGKIIKKLLQTGYHIIIRPHPQSFESEKELMDKLMSEFPASENLEWNRDTDNFEVLRRSDIMISDFSGVIYDFALIFGKPIIYTEPKIDISPYDIWWLKKELWTISALPKIGCELINENIDDIKDIIDSCLTEQKYADGLKIIKEESWECFGEGTKNVVNYLTNKYDEIIKKNQQDSLDIINKQKNIKNNKQKVLKEEK